MLSGSSTPFCCVTITTDPAMKRDAKIGVEVTGAKETIWKPFNLPAPYAYKEGNSIDEVCMMHCYCKSLEQGPGSAFLTLTFLARFPLCLSQWLHVCTWMEPTYPPLDPLRIYCTWYMYSGPTQLRVLSTAKMALGVMVMGIGWPVRSICRRVAELVPAPVLKVSMKVFFCLSGFQ